MIIELHKFYDIFNHLLKINKEGGDLNMLRKDIGYLGQSISWKPITLDTFYESGMNSYLVKFESNIYYAGILEVYLYTYEASEEILPGYISYTIFKTNIAGSVSINTIGTVDRMLDLISIVPTDDGVRITLLKQKEYLSIGIVYKSYNHYQGSAPIITDVVGEHLSSIIPDNRTILKLDKNMYYYKVLDNEFKPIPKSVNSMDNSDEKIVNSKKYPAGNNTKEFITIGEPFDYCAELVKEHKPGYLGGSRDSYATISAKLYTYNNKYITCGCYYHHTNNNGFRLMKDKYDVYIDGKLYYKIVKFDNTNIRFKNIFNYLGHIISDLGIKGIPVRRDLGVTHDDFDLGSFRHSYAYGYLLEDGYLAVEYRKTTDYAFEDTAWYNGLFPYISESYKSYDIEKKLHNFYLLNNIISSPLYKHNKGGVIIC